LTLSCTNEKTAEPAKIDSTFVLTDSLKMNSIRVDSTKVDTLKKVEVKNPFLKK
jgi:hypothetical protein